jgi:hypothetical protein
MIYKVFDFKKYIHVMEFVIRYQQHRHGRRCDKSAKALERQIEVTYAHAAPLRPEGQRSPPPPVGATLFHLGGIVESDAVSFGL